MSDNARQLEQILVILSRADIVHSIIDIKRQLIQLSYVPLQPSFLNRYKLMWLFVHYYNCTHDENKSDDCLIAYCLSQDRPGKYES